MLRLAYQKLSRLWYKLVTLKSSPRKIARGFALGIFLSFTPTFGFQTALAVGLATALRVNPISTVAGVYLTNIFTAWPLYALCHQVGCLVVGAEWSLTHAGAGMPIEWGLLDLTRLGLKWIALEFLGAIIVGGLSSVPAYFLALFAVIKYRTARLNHRIRRMRERIAQPQERGAERSGSVPETPSDGGTREQP